MGYSGKLSLCNAIFGIDPADYSRRASYGLLIGSGAGIMMAVMDAAPQFRLAVDVDQYKGREDRLRDWVRALDRNGLVDLVAICGWFSITDPALLTGALDGLSAPILVYAGGLQISAQVRCADTLDEFLRCVAQTQSTGVRDEWQRLTPLKHDPKRAFEPSAWV